MTIKFSTLILMPGKLCGLSAGSCTGNLFGYLINYIYNL